MGIWQNKEDLLALLRSPIYDQQQEAGKLLVGFDDNLLDTDVVRALLDVMAKQNKNGNNCWRVTVKGQLRNPDEEDLCFCHTAKNQIKNVEELLRIIRNNNDFPGGGAQTKHQIASDKILPQAIWVLGNIDADLSDYKEQIKKELNDLIQSGLFGDDVVLESIRTLQRLGLLSELELLSALNTVNARVQWFLLEALTQVQPSPRTIGLLVSVMLNQMASAALRSMVAKNLVSIEDKRVEEPLIGLLADPNPNIREHAALTLGERKSKAATTSLFQLLIDEDDMVRLAAGTALGSLGDPRTIPFLLKAKEHGDIRIQEVATKAIKDLGTNATTSLVQAMRVEEMPYKLDALRILRGLKDPRSILALIESMLDDDLFEEARETINEMHEVAEKPLLFVAKSNDIDSVFREKCLRILIENGAGSTIEALESMLDAKETGLQILAIQLLGDLPHEKSAGLLWNQLDRPLGGTEKLRARLKTKKQQENAPDPRFLAIEIQKEESLQDQFLAETLLALGKQQEAKAIPELLKGLEQRDSRIYSFSISALGYVEATEAVDPLCSIIKSREGRYKEQAIQTLARIGDSRSVPFLRQVVKDVQTEREYRPDAPSSLASYAIQALAKLGDLQVIQMILTAWEDELEGAVLTLGTNAIPQLIDALANSNSPKIRLLSAEALGFLGAKDAMGSLITALQDKDEDVRNMSAWSLNEVYANN
jgi:HEAT repeat protein